MTDGTDALRAIVHTALLTPSPLRRYRARPGRRATHGDIGLVASAAPGPGGNAVLVLGPAAPARVFALAEAFFDAGQGYSITVEVGTARLVEEELRARGWQLNEEEPALVLPRLPAVFPPPPPGLTIRPVADEAGLTDFRLVSETPPQVLPSLAAARDPAVALFVGYHDGQPVASARLVCLGRVADITGVVTLPAYRRRGFGTTLTWAAIAEGAARGCHAATLTATPLGYPVYVRMDFLPVCTYRTYLPPDSASG